MNAHRRMEAKRARRRARIGDRTRGRVRGPITRGAARAALMNKGEERIFAMVRSTRTPGVLRRMKGKVAK